jgi:transposase
MAVALLRDALGDLVEPLLPRFRHDGHREGGRAFRTVRVSPDIVFVLRSGAPWQMLPLELG